MAVENEKWEYKNQESGFFEVENEAKKIDDWQDMPEFVQEKNDAFRKIIISFTSEEDAQAFGKLLDQHVTDKTKSLWYPPKDKKDSLSMWIDD